MFALNAVDLGPKIEYQVGLKAIIVGPETVPVGPKSHRVPAGPLTSPFAPDPITQNNN